MREMREKIDRSQETFSRGMLSMLECRKVRGFALDVDGTTHPTTVIVEDSSEGTIRICGFLAEVAKRQLLEAELKEFQISVEKREKLTTNLRCIIANAGQPKGAGK